MTKREKGGSKSLRFDIRVEPANQARALKIMETVSAALSQRAFQIRVGDDKKTEAEKDGVLVQFHIEELYKQITETQTWGKDSTRTYTHIVGREPLGRLALMLDDWAGQFRRSFKDGKKQMIENIIEEFIDTVEKVVVYRKQQAEEQARWERDRRERRARRELEEARVKALERQLELIVTARNLRDYLARLSSEPDTELKNTWVTWVTRYLGRVEALIGIPDVAPQNDVAGHLDWAEENFEDLE